MLGFCVALAARGSSSTECTADEGSVSSPVGLALTYSDSHTIGASSCSYFTATPGSPDFGYVVNLSNNGTDSLNLRVFDNEDYESPDDCGKEVAESGSDYCDIGAGATHYIKIENESSEKQEFDLVVNVAT